MWGKPPYDDLPVVVMVSPHSQSTSPTDMQAKLNCIRRVHTIHTRDTTGATTPVTRKTVLLDPTGHQLHKATLTSLGDIADLIH